MDLPKGDRGDTPGPSQGFLNGAVYKAVYRSLIFELCLQLGRVDIHVDPERIDLQEEHEERKASLLQEAFVRGVDRVVDCPVQNVSSIQEEELE